MMAEKPVKLMRDELRERYPSMVVQEASMAKLKAKIADERQAERDAIRAETFEEAVRICESLTEAVDPYNAAGTRGEIMAPAFMRAAVEIRKRAQPAAATD